MSERSQRVVVWWGIAFAVIYGLALIFLLDMVPPPSPTLSSTAVAHWYSVRHSKILVGAVICSWTSAFLIPWAAVTGIQMARQERGGKIWTVLTISTGAMMSIFLVLPPLFWGVAAFTPSRAPEITAIMHELGMLTLVTTDQFYVFMWVGIAVICFLPTNVRHSPFPRWFGYLTAWTCVMFEAGAFAFLTKTGPFAWNGLLVFWSPLTLFGLWLTVSAYLLLHNLRLQQEEAAAEHVTAAARGIGVAAADPVARAI